jgi:DNA-binding IclR family transcriptional regulator
VVEKAFTVLEGWTHRSEIVGVSELARRTGLAKSTTNRLLSMLDSAGVIERATGGYRIAYRFQGFAELLWPGHRPSLREVALPFLQDLYELTHETIHLGVVDDIDVRCVDALFGHRPSPLRYRVGDPLPVHSTALGKVLMAYSPDTTQRHVLSAAFDGRSAAKVAQPRIFTAELSTIRRQGVAFDRQETHPKVTCVAAPVLSRTGEAVAAISISGPTDRFDALAVVDALRRTAKAASVALATGRPVARAA